MDGFGIGSSHATKSNPIQHPSTTSTSTYKEYEDENIGFDDMAWLKPSSSSRNNININIRKENNEIERKEEGGCVMEICDDMVD